MVTFTGKGVELARLNGFNIQCQDEDENAENFERYLKAIASYSFCDVRCENCFETTLTIFHGMSHLFQPPKNMLW